MRLRHPPPTNVELDLILTDFVALPLLSLSRVREVVLRNAEFVSPPGGGWLICCSRALLEEGEFP